MAVVSAGIDVGLLGGKGLDLVALDMSRTVVAAIRHASLEDVVRVILDELRPAVVCIDSPSQWWAGTGRREAEQALLRAGIKLYATPSEARATAFHAWMRDGFAVYAALADAYPRYGGGAVTGTAAEYFPHATAVTLAGRIGEYRGRHAFRRELLSRYGVGTSGLTGPDQADAALGALTGLIGLEGGHSWVGGPGDALLLPVRRLRSRYARNAASAAAEAAPPAPRPYSYGSRDVQPGYESQGWKPAAEPWGRDPWADE